MDLVADVERAAVGFRLAEEDPEQRGLAGAVRADDGDALAARDFEVEAAEERALAEALRERLDADARLARLAPRLEPDGDLPVVRRRGDALDPVEPLLPPARLAAALRGVVAPDELGDERNE